MGVSADPNSRSPNGRATVRPGPEGYRKLSELSQPNAGSIVCGATTGHKAVAARSRPLVAAINGETRVATSPAPTTPVTPDRTAAETVVKETWPSNSCGRGPADQESAAHRAGARAAPMRRPARWRSTGNLPDRKSTRL